MFLDERRSLAATYGTLGCKPRMSTTSVHVTYRFGEFQIDLAAYELRRGGHRISLVR